MNNLFAILPYVGKLYYHHIYLYYDEPLIFSCINETFQMFLSLAVPDTNDGHGAWLLVPVSSGRLEKLEKNAEEIRAVFTKPESALWRVVFKTGSYEIEQLDPKDLTDEMLPEKGELLDYSSASQELVASVDAPIAQASREMRDIIELSFENDDSHISEITCTALSDALNGVQQLMYAIGYKDGGLRGAIPKKIREDCCLCVSGMFAASVGIRLKSDELCDLQCETPLTSTLEDFNLLFSVSHDKELLRKFLEKQNPRVAVKYRSLLRTLLNHKLGIRFNNASPNNHTFVRHFSTKELVKNLELVNSEISEITEMATVYGQLVGINVERCTFEFITTESENIKGVLSNEISGEVFSIPQVGEAMLEISVGTDSMSKEEKLVYKLIAFEPIVNEEGKN